MRVYARALDLAADLDAIAEQIPARRADLRDQLYRAASSIVLNLAEGAAEYSPAEKAKFYRYARRSAAECAGAIDLLERIGHRSERLARAADELDQICSILTAMGKTAEARRRRN